MRTSALRWDSLVVIVVYWHLVFVSIASHAASPSSEFAAAKQTFLKEMKKSSPVARASAVKAFSNVAQTGTAELLLKRGVVDDDPNVRKATRAALRKVAADTTVCRYMIEELRRSLRRPTGIQVSEELFRALLCAENPEQQEEVVKFVEEIVSAPKANLLVPMTMIDEFGEQGDADAVKSVAMMSKVKLFESHFGYRRCIVQAMTHIRQPGSIDFLIELLPNTQGQIQQDVVQYLTRLTKQKFRDNEREWTQWWKENRKEFEFPAADVELPEIEEDNEPLSYYGIPICAKRVVFVLDTSASMRGSPMAAAKTALLKTVDSLPESVYFDIVMFDVDAATWSPRLVAATDEAKKLASQAVMSRGLGPATVSSAALNASFRLDPEAIYFVSDGEPTDGPPAEIVNAVTQLNRTRRISIHTIGVVTNRHGGGGLTQFMQPLSKQNYGKFLLIE